jgi:hypothetical protein
MFRNAVTTPCNGDERPKGGPEREREVRRIAPNNPSATAASKPFCAFAILRRWFADPWQTPLVACDEPLVCTPRHMTSHAHLEIALDHLTNPDFSGTAKIWGGQMSCSAARHCEAYT